MTSRRGRFEGDLESTFRRELVDNRRMLTVFVFGVVLTVLDVDDLNVCV